MVTTILGLIVAAGVFLVFFGVTMARRAAGVLERALAPILSQVALALRDVGAVSAVDEQRLASREVTLG